MELKTYVVRPFSKPARTDWKDVFRIHLSPVTMLLHELNAGDVCHIQKGSDVLGCAITWPALEKIMDSVVQTSKALQTLYSLKLGDKISILPTKNPVEDANLITLCEFYSTNIKNPPRSLIALDIPHWSWFLEHVLEKAEHLSSGMLFENIELRGDKRSFEISSINSKRDSALFRAHSSSKIVIQGTLPEEHGGYGSPPQRLEISGDDIGGLTSELERLNKHLAAYSEQQRKMKLPAYYRRHRGGVILYGPSGTGKSMLLQKIGAAPWQKVFQIDSAFTSRQSSNTEVLVQNIFEEALRYQPSVIIIDDLQSVAGKRDLVENRNFDLNGTLCEGLDRLGGARVLAVAATTSLAEVDATLRSPGRFEFEIEIPVPDSTARIEILKVARGLPKEAEAKELENLGDRSHGFVGADLDKLTQLAVEKAIERVSAVHSNVSGCKADVRPEFEVKVTETDLNNALLDVRPTAMREVFLETPKVKWSDIGGQHVVKKVLKQAVEWPFKAWL